MYLFSASTPTPVGPERCAFGLFIPCASSPSRHGLGGVFANPEARARCAGGLSLSGWYAWARRRESADYARWHAHAQGCIQSADAGAGVRARVGIESDRPSGLSRVRGGDSRNGARGELCVRR
jgi:hypothetical protein